MRPALPVLLLLCALGLTALAAPPRQEASEAESYTIDGVHSNVLFKVLHNNASWFYGRFDEVGGSFTLDADDPAKCSLSVEVPVASVSTRSEKLDAHLRSDDFFAAEEHPAITFVSKKVAAGEREGVYAITGDLTVRGTTKSITVEAEHVGTSEGRRGKVVGFHIVFTIDRTEFGVSYGAGGPLGSDVELIISIEARMD